MVYKTKLGKKIQSQFRVSLPHVLQSPLYTVVRGIYRFLINGPEKNSLFKVDLG